MQIEGKGEARTIYVWWSEDGQRIRAWSRGGLQAAQLREKIGQEPTVFTTPPEATKAEQDALDAARYRLLRDIPATSLPDGPFRVWLANRPFGWEGSIGLDALCDAAAMATGDSRL